MKHIDELLSEADDYELCSGVFGRFAEFNNQIDVSSYTEEERVVTLVRHSFGIIGNGGFEYLFAGDFKGDPGFTHTAAAFKAIGASESYAAFQRALASFKHFYPARGKDRVEAYRQMPEEERNSIDRQFFDDKSMQPALARYIRERRDRFRELLSRPSPKKSIFKRLFQPPTR